jgi:L-alanine-DL-glutamate epimerase-like enolase superfamily enzyme
MEVDGRLVQRQVRFGREDPEAHDKIHLVNDHPFNTIAAGEKATVSRELYDLYARGRVRNLIIDVQYVGGPVRFMEAARLLNALGDAAVFKPLRGQLGLGKVRGALTAGSALSQPAFSPQEYCDPV